MDVLSDGRLEIGLGAGWMISDYEQAGHPLRPGAGVRIDRFVEGLAVIRRAMSGDDVLLRRRALHGHRLRRPPEAGAAAVPADPHRRRRQAGARASPAARPTSSGSTARCTRAASARARSPTMTAEAVDEKVGYRRAPRPARASATIEMNIRVFMPTVTDDRDKALADLAAGLGQPVDLLDRDAVRPDRQPGEDRRGPARPARAVGLLATSSSGRTRSSRSPRSSPSWPGAECRTVGTPTIALCGAGWIAAAHAAAARGAGYELVAVASRSPQRAAEQAAKLGSAGGDATTSCPAGADVVVVATPPQAHAADALRLLDAGAAVLLEKPLCRTLDEADAIVAAAAAARRAAALRREPGLRAGGGRDASAGPPRSGALTHLEVRTIQALPTWGDVPHRRVGRRRAVRPRRPPAGVGPAARRGRAVRAARSRSSAELRGGAGHGTDEHAEVASALRRRPDRARRGQLAGRAPSRCGTCRRRATPACCAWNCSRRCCSSTTGRRWRCPRRRRRSPVDRAVRLPRPAARAGRRRRRPVGAR